MAAAKLALEDAARWQEVELRAGVLRARQVDGADRTERTGSLTLGLTAPLPLWNLREGELQARRAALQAAEWEWKAETAILVSRASLAHARLHTAVKALAEFQALLRLSKEHLALAESSLEDGRLSLAEFLRFQREDLDLVLVAHEHEVAAAEAKVEFDRLSGRHHALVQSFFFPDLL